MTKYSEKELIKELQRVSEEHCDGNTPTIKDMDKYGNFSSSTYGKRFGGWTEAVKKSGFIPNQIRELTKKEVISDIKRISEEHLDGQTPRKKDINPFVDYSSSVYRKWGGFAEVLRCAGVRPSQNMNREEVIKEIQNYSRKHCSGKAPHKDDFEENANISSSTVISFFDTWNNAIKKSGLKPRRIRNIPKEKLISHMKNISDEYYNSNLPYIETFDLYSDFSSSTYENRFGSWNNALEEIFGEVNSVQELSQEELLKDIKKISDSFCNGNRPTLEIYRSESNHSPTSIRHYFDSWNNAVEKAGFERYELGATGEDHWCWKGGNGYYYGLSWWRQRDEAWRRDGFECRVCGIGGEVIGRKPDTHHITPARYWDVEKEHKKMNHPRNLISLCRSCHHKLEGKFKGRNHEEFEELAKDYLDIEETEEKKGIFDY